MRRPDALGANGPSDQCVRGAALEAAAPLEKVRERVDVAPVTDEDRRRLESGELSEATKELSDGLPVDSGRVAREGHCTSIIVNSNV